MNEMIGQNEGRKYYHYKLGKGRCVHILTCTLIIFNSQIKKDNFEGNKLHSGSRTATSSSSYIMQI